MAKKPPPNPDLKKEQLKDKLRQQRDKDPKGWGEKHLPKKDSPYDKPRN